MTDTARQRRRRILWRIAILTPVVLIALGVWGWLAFQHIPAWYHPTLVSDETAPDVVNEASRWADTLAGGVNQSKKPFQVFLTQDQVNRWLAVPPRYWPMSPLGAMPEFLPPSLSDPCVTFEPGAIRLAATYRSKSIATVICMRFLVEGRRDWLWLTLDSVQLGSLPVPKATIRDQLARLDKGPWPARRITRYQNLPERIPALVDLLDGIRVPNSWKWPKSDKPFWVTSLKVEQGQILAEIEPLPGGPATSGR